MQITIAARDTLGAVHLFRDSVDGPEQFPEYAQAARDAMKEGGAVAHVVLIGIDGGKA